MNTTSKLPNNLANRAKNEPKAKKPRQSRSKIKVMLIVFFGCRSVVHHEFIPEGQTVNKEYYLAVLRRLRGAIRRKRPDLLADNSWIFPHDNVTVFARFGSL